MAIYYISSAGNDELDGLAPNSAWRSLSKIFQSQRQLAPGDRVLLARGSVWHGALRIRSQNILVGSYGDGPAPVIDGSHSAEADWQEIHPGIWRVMAGKGAIISSVYDGADKLTKRAPGAIRWWRDDELPKYLDTFQPGDWGPGTHEWVYVATRDGQRPGDSIRVFHNACVQPASGCTIEHLELRRGWYGVNFANESAVTIRGCRIHETPGIGIYGRSGNTNAKFEDNEASDNGGTAIYSRRSRGSVIRGNRIRRTLQRVLGIEVGGDKAGIGLESNVGSLVEGNHVADVIASGVDFYEEEDSEVRGNVIMRPGAGGLYPHGTGLRVHDNVCRLEGVGNGCNSGQHKPGAPNEIFDNVFTDPQSFGLMGNAGDHYHGNVVVGGRGLALYNPGVESDHNLFVSSASQRIFRFDGKWHHDLASFRLASGQDSHSLLLRR